MAASGKLDRVSKKNWEQDKDVAACADCAAAFGGFQAALVVRRRHHCRVCGRVFCADCCPSTNLVVLPTTYGKAAQRACNRCYVELQDSVKTIELEVGNSHVRLKDDDEEALAYQQQYMSTRWLGSTACHRCIVFVRPGSDAGTLARNALTQVDFKFQSKGVRITEPPWETDFSQLWTAEGYVYIHLYTIDGGTTQLKHWVNFGRPVVFKAVGIKLTLHNCRCAALPDSPPHSHGVWARRKCVSI